jgi:hypothetical protein
MPAYDIAAVACEPGDRSATTARRLVVTWQHPADRNIEPVGFLEYDGECYRFGYIRHVLSVEDFRPLLGFRDLYRTYSSEELFPLFAQRVMDPRRPDYQRYVERLGLDEEEAGPWEQIERSQGRRRGDTIQLLPQPTTDGETLTCLFLVNGVRHIPEMPLVLGGRQIEVTREQVEAALARLRPGDALQLAREPENKANPLALLVVAPAATPVGWVPNLMVEDMHQLVAQSDVDVTTAHVNGPDAPWHLRLLVQLTARGAGDFRFFTGERWELLSGPPAQ